jgi:hypothetical protein
MTQARSLSAAADAVKRGTGGYARRAHPAPISVSTRCGLTGVGTHDRLRASFTPARRQLPHQAAPSRTIVPCLLPRLWRSASRRRPCCSSCETPAPISRGWSRRFRGISSRSSSCPSRAWTRGSGESPRSGGRSAAGWPSGESQSTGSSGDRASPGSKEVVGVRGFEPPTPCSQSLLEQEYSVPAL